MSRSGSLRSLLLEGARDDSQVLVTQSLVRDSLPFIRQAVKHRETVVTERLLREVHVLERERQRELRRELAPGDPLQLGGLPRGNQRAVANRLRDVLDAQGPAAGLRATDAATASFAKASQVLFTSFRRVPAPAGAI